MLLLKDSANDLILLKRTQPDMYEGQKMTGNLKKKPSIQEAKHKLISASPAVKLLLPFKWYAGHVFSGLPHFVSLPPTYFYY